MLIELSGLFLGLVGLWLGTEWTLNSTIDIASHYKLSDWFIGMGILAIGTDIPELAVAIDAGIRNHQGAQLSDMVIGSSIGSAFAQIGLVLGIVGLSGYLLIGKKYLVHHGSMLIGAIVILWLVGYDGVISQLDGLILLVLFTLYFLLLLRNESQSHPQKLKQPLKLFELWFKLTAGLITVIAASELTIHSAVYLAESLQIPQILIATFIVGIGTSLPELSISLKAIRQRRGALSVGNILGSNIFDTLVPIGIAAIISPLSFNHSLLYIDLPALAAISLLVLLFFFKKKGLQRREAIVILLAYTFYIVTNIVLKSSY